MSIGEKRISKEDRKLIKKFVKAVGALEAVTRDANDVLFNLSDALESDVEYIYENKTADDLLDTIDVIVFEAEGLKMEGKETGSWFMQQLKRVQRAT